MHQHPEILRRLADERRRELLAHRRPIGEDGLQPGWEHRFHLLDDAARIAEEFIGREFTWSIAPTGEFDRR